MNTTTTKNCTNIQMLGKMITFQIEIISSKNITENCGMLYVKCDAHIDG